MVLRGAVAYLGVLLAGAVSLAWYLVEDAWLPWSCFGGTVAGSLLVLHRHPHPHVGKVVALMPLGVVVALFGWMFAFEAIGADCPQEGMDYLDLCNDRAQLAMLGWIWGPAMFATSLIVAALYGLIELVRAIRHPRRRGI